jgi:hypothetical protein
MLPADRAPAYPTQYAGEPTFLCLGKTKVVHLLSNTALLPLPTDFPWFILDLTNCFNILSDTF